MTKVPLGKAQKEMRNILLETKARHSCCIVTESLAEMCPAITWKAELVRMNLDI